MDVARDRRDSVDVACTASSRGNIQAYISRRLDKQPRRIRLIGDQGNDIQPNQRTRQFVGIGPVVIGLHVAGQIHDAIWNRRGNRLDLDGVIGF